MQPFAFQLLPAAERDFFNQVHWLEVNYSSAAADRFAEQVYELINRLRHQPYLASPLDRKEGRIYKALIDKRYLLFYTVEDEHALIKILAIRGAAEDWTNQPLPTD